QTEVRLFMHEEELFVNESDFSNHLGRDHHAATVDNVDLGYRRSRAVLQRNRSALEELGPVGCVKHTAFGLNVMRRVKITDHGAEDCKLRIRGCRGGQSLDQLRADNCVVVEEDHEVGMMPAGESYAEIVSACPAAVEGTPQHGTSGKFHRKNR